ncbi:ABC transporter ATP-binding protein [Nocardioides jensenii]|uniref:ABC transporter ATP-binding protein n=1 Tax=Nocardioides jensenii TaxID=1843 RepID=UPI00082D3C6F|nr:ABC transporter ATP-binding protein [Nocardioides jensenii]
MRIPALEVVGLAGGYGDTQVLRGVELAVQPGTVTALLGANGAGKTTLLKTIAGTLRPHAGSVSVGGVDVTAQKAHTRARAGVCMIPEGRGIFPNLTVAENLRMATPPWRKGEPYDPALEAFPALAERLHQRAGSMSGGQQQMLALSRCFLSQPDVVLLDEVSMGLAPKVIDEIFESLRQLAERGVALLVVEQYVHRALEMADFVHLMSRGSIGFSGTPDQIDEEQLQREYLGESDSTETTNQTSAVSGQQSKVSDEQ